MCNVNCRIEASSYFSLDDPLTSPSRKGTHFSFSNQREVPSVSQTGSPAQCTRNDYSLQLGGKCKELAAVTLSIRLSKSATEILSVIRRRMIRYGQTTARTFAETKRLRRSFWNNMLKQNEEAIKSTTLSSTRVIVMVMVYCFIWLRKQAQAP